MNIIEFITENRDLMMCAVAIVFGIYLLYESLEAAIEDNRGRGIMRGLRYIITASFGLWLVWNGVKGTIDMGDLLGGAAISIRFLANVEKRWKAYRGSGKTSTV